MKFNENPSKLLGDMEPSRKCYTPNGGQMDHSYNPTSASRQVIKNQQRTKNHAKLQHTKEYNASRFFFNYLQKTHTHRDRWQSKTL